MNYLTEIANKLKDDVLAGKRGVERELSDFVREYSGDIKLERRLVLLSRKLTAAYSLEKTQSLNEELIEEVNNIINNVVKNYSSVTIRSSRSLHLKSELHVIESFVSKKQVAFSCKNLTKIYGTDFTLHPVTMEVRKGDITAVVGENGNGKTTFFRMVAGELAQDDGEINYPMLEQGMGENKDWIGIKKRIAYVPQELPRWLGNLKANLHYEAAIHGVPSKKNEEEVDFVIDRLGLREHIKKRWKDLSGGYKFRFALARALVWKPDIMILDEPLANLDVNAQIKVLRDLKSLATSITHPIAVLISSQHLHEVESIADSLMFLKRGMPIFNDRINKLGADRTENLFEVGSYLPFTEFCRLFPAAMPITFQNNGMHYILTTELQVKADQILQILIHANATPEYFRDISRSSKRLFKIRAA